MQLRSTFSFLFTSVMAGLAAAAVLLFLRSEIRQPVVVTERVSPPVDTAYTAGLGTGPVSYAEAVAEAGPAVLNIFTTKITTERSNPLLSDPLVRQFFGDYLSSRPRKRLETSLGSAVVISSQGYMLTNFHVIDGAEEIRVVLHNGSNVSATVVGNDPETDVAVLHVNADDLPTLAMGDSENLRVGDVVLAIGNPFGVGQTVTMGIVSATGRNNLGINTFEDFIQTDAAINPGNSGGALINARGELVGINTAIFSKSGGYQGIGFAIPVNLAKGVMGQVIRHGRAVRGWLGIQARDFTPEVADAYGLAYGQGVFIEGVLENGPADKVGLRPGDVITHLDGEPAKDSYEVLNIIARKAPGSQLQIHGFRGNKALDLLAVVTERPQRTRVQ